MLVPITGSSEPFGPAWTYVPYLPIQFTERLAEAGIERSVASIGDSYDSPSR